MEIYNGRSDEKDAGYLLAYLNDVLLPASEEFFSHLSENDLALHHVFSFNAIVAHAVDYMVFIAQKQSKVCRGSLIRDFDERYAVAGSRHINDKFTLLDAVNNSFKHVELNKNRYRHLIKQYGDLSFHSLQAAHGKVFFAMPAYRFDYSRVVLRPVARIFNCGIKSTHDIDDFINGRICGCSGYVSYNHYYEPHDAIERMIDYCNPECTDCGEAEDNCDCPNYQYITASGDFIPDTDPAFDFEDVMSEISGTREWSR